MKIVFACGKGGVGKSTLCYLMALGLKQAGKQVVVEDRDPQKSITAWVNPERDGVGLVEASDDTAAAGGLHLVDTRPAIDDDSVLAAIGEADRLVVPCSPSPGDISAIGATLSVIGNLKRPDARVMVVLNKLRPGTILAQEARTLLESFGHPVLVTELPERQCVQKAVVQGWDALDPKTEGVVFKLAVEVIS